MGGRVRQESRCRLEKALDGTDLQDAGKESWERALDGKLSGAGAFGSQAESSAEAEDVYA